MTSQQQPLFDDPASRPAVSGHEPAPVWLQRASLIILVLFCFYIGLIVVILPWIPGFWIHNGWLVAHPAVHAFVQQGWFRGVLSGLGLIDIWIGISEAMHYREQRRREAEQLESPQGIPNPHGH